MKHRVKHVLIAGGTGFIGYHSALLFLKKGCKVSAIALPDEIELEGWYPKAIQLQFGNLFEMSEEAIFGILKNKNLDTFIYALGPDDRMVPPAPAYDFFHLRLVEQCLKICKAAKKAGIKRCVVLNSYFAFFDQLQNGALSKNHPYIRSRVEQAAAVFAIGQKGIFEVMVLELPFIFGVMPSRIPLWKNVFIDRFKKSPIVLFPDGGTAAIHVTDAAKAVVASAFNGIHGESYPIGNANIKYKDLLYYLMASVGFPKKIISAPACFFYFVGRWIKMNQRRKGLESGLDPVKMMTQILSKDLYIDPIPSQKKLRYEELGFIRDGDIGKGIREVAKKCCTPTFKEIPNPEWLTERTTE